MADPRNDQTLILLQLHVALQMFHNKLVDHVRKNLVSALFPGLSVFESARRLARWHYQWMVTHDFLPAIVGKAMADSVYKEVLTGLPIINLKYYRTINPLGRPFIPVEFSVAAYRFGHSIARPRYTVRDFIDTRTGATVAVSERPALRGRADRQQPERAPPDSASAEDAVEQVLQHGREASDRPARAPVRRQSVRRALPAAGHGAPRQQPDEPARRTEPPPGQEDAPAVRTADRSADGRDAAHATRSCTRITASRCVFPSSATWWRCCASSTSRTRISRRSSRIRDGTARRRCGSTS